MALSTSGRRVSGNVSRRRQIAITLAAAAMLAVQLAAPKPRPAAASTPTTPFGCPIVDQYEIRDGFGAPRNGFNHGGVDLYAGAGTPILLMESGTVRRVVNTDDYPADISGLHILIEGDSGYGHAYIHNSVNLVSAGQRVEKGQLIGRVGATGEARFTGAHLHFEIRVNGWSTDDGATPIDPSPLLGEACAGGHEPTATFDEHERSSNLPVEAAFDASRSFIYGGSITRYDWEFGDGSTGSGSIGTHEYGRAGVYRAALTVTDDRGATGSAWTEVRVSTAPVAGDLNGDGDDEIAVYDAGRWYVDVNDSGSWDPDHERRGVRLRTAGGAGDVAAVYRPGDGGRWHIDANGNGGWDGDGTDREVSFGYVGTSPAPGDFNADGTDEIAVYDGASSGAWYIDTNNNGTWDGATTDTKHSFGFAGSLPATGDFDANGTDEIAVYDGANGGAWYIDTNNNGTWDGATTDTKHSFGFAGSLPATGDFDADGTDELGVFESMGPGRWFVDSSQNGAWSAEVDSQFTFDALVDDLIEFGALGSAPAIGDFTGDDVASLASYDDDGGVWLVDTNNNRAWDGTEIDSEYAFGFDGTNGVIGDLNADGLDEIAVYDADDGGHWYVDTNNNGAWDGTEIDSEYAFGFDGTNGVIGDLNADGLDEIAVYDADDGGHWYVDTNNNGAWDGTEIDSEYAFGFSGTFPVASDFDGDGRDEIAVFAGSMGRWFVDLNENHRWDGSGIDTTYVFGY